MHIEMKERVSGTNGVAKGAFAVAGDEQTNSNGAPQQYTEIEGSSDSGQKVGCCSKLSACCTDPSRWLEKVPIVGWLPKYSLQDLHGDAVAGTTVALTVIPQGLALATVANLDPQYGLYTAFMGSFMYTIFGSCKDLTIGPTAIMSIMTGQYVKTGGPVYAVLLSLLSGLLQLLMGLLNMGFIIDFIAASVISGFTSAAAMTIACGQLKGLTGVQIESEHFFEAIYEFFVGIKTISYADTLLGVSCIVIILLMRHYKDARISKGHCCLPDAVVSAFNGIWWTMVTARNVLVVLVCGAAAAILDAQGERPFSLTGTVHGGLPDFRVPSFSDTTFDPTTNVTTTKQFSVIVSDIGVGIVVIALLSILESVAIAKAFTKGKRLNASQEMFALGCCNIAGSFVSAYPATGSFSRTAINNSSGVRTPLGGVFTGLIVLAALAFLSPYFYFIPKAALAAIIITAVIFMVHIEDVKVMWRTSKIDLIPFTFTFIGSFLFGLEYGIMMGVAVAVLLLMHHHARPQVTVYTKKASSSSYVAVCIDRTILFPSALYVTGKIGRRIREQTVPLQLEGRGALVVVDCEHINKVDYTTCMAFKSLHMELEKEKSVLSFTNLSPEIAESLRAVLLEDFKCFDHEKDIEDFIDGLGSTKVDISATGENL